MAVCDSNFGRAELFAGRYGGRAFHDVPQMLRESGAEAVFVCTPHPLHAEPAILSARAGLHVMVEKPMAATLSDCDAMLRAAEKSGVRLSVMSQRRFYEPVRRMKDAIEAGKIGRPVLGLFLQDFLQAIRAGRPPLVTGEDGRAVVEIFSAIYESNKDRSSISLV